MSSNELAWGWVSCCVMVDVDCLPSKVLANFLVEVWSEWTRLDSDLTHSFNERKDA